MPLFKPDISALAKRGDVKGLVNVLKSKKIDYKDFALVIHALATIKTPQAIAVLRELSFVEERRPIVDGVLLEGVLCQPSVRLRKEVIKLLIEIGGDDAGKALVDVFLEQGSEYDSEILSAMKKSNSASDMSETRKFLISKLDEKGKSKYKIVKMLQNLDWEPKTPKEIACKIFGTTSESELPGVITATSGDARNSFEDLIIEEGFYPEALAALNTPKTIAKLYTYLEDPSSYYFERWKRWKAAHALCKIRDENLFITLIKYINSDEDIEEPVKYEPLFKQELIEIIRTIADIGGERAMAPLFQMLMKQQPNPRYEAMKTVLMEKKNMAIPFLTELLKKWEPDAILYLRCLIDFGWQSEVSTEIILIIIKKLNDAVTAEGRNIGIELVTRLTDQHVLAEAAKSSVYTQAHAFALRKLTDCDLLLDVFNNIKPTDVSYEFLFSVFCDAILRLKSEVIHNSATTETIAQMQNAIEDRLNEIVLLLQSPVSREKIHKSGGTWYGTFERGYLLINELVEMLQASISLINDILLKSLSELNLEFTGREYVYQDDRGDDVDEYDRVRNCGKINTLCKEELLRRNR